MSSFLPNIIVSQTLKEFKSTSIRNPEELKKKVEKGRDRLYGFQHPDGGWGWWKTDDTDSFMTAYVIDGLSLAQQAGYEIDRERLVRGREKLRTMVESGDGGDLDMRSFMVYALAESGGVEPKHVEKLFAERKNLQPYGRALLALTLSLLKDQRAWEVATEIERSATLDQLTAHWDQTEGTALSLKALTHIKPESPLLPLAARWLVASDRKNGAYWDSTKDTAFAIFGLIDYVKINRELTPSYDVEVYLNGETVLVEHVADARTLNIIRKGAAVGETNHIRVVKRGKGALYLSMSVDYYTNDENVAARGSADLSVTREYLRPRPGDIKSGDLLIVKLHVTGKKGRHLMLEDPIPCGAEQTDGDNSWSVGYSAREFRDRRTVFFVDHFDGDEVFQYALRVQIPGEFVVAPARAELMYEPGINANSGSARLSFLDRGDSKH